MTVTLFSVIDETITIDATLMQSLRDNLDTANPPDPLIHRYLFYQRDDEGDLIEPADERISGFNGQLADYAKDAMYYAIKYHTPVYDSAIVDHLIRGICNDTSSDNYVYIKPTTMTSPNQAVSGANPGSIVQLIFNTDNVYFYCNGVPFDSGNLHLNNYGTLDTLSNYNRLYYASDGLAYVSFIYDMLYEEMTDGQKQDTQENIEILSGYLYNYLKNPTAIGMTAWSSFYSPFWANTSGDGSINWGDGYDKINILGARSFELIASLGYSRLVLGHLPGNDPILDWVIYMMDSVPIQEDINGMLQYIVKKSGAYCGGYGYASQALKASPQFFFTALNRLSEINYWDNQYIRRLFNSEVDNLTPGYYTATIEEDWWDRGGIDRGIMEYYYQNTNDLIGRDKIKWYLYRLKARGGEWPSTKNAHYSINFPIVYSYNPSNPVTADNYQPQSTLSGVFSNQEFTHLSLPLSGGQTCESTTYKNRLWLHVNHENSYEEENFHRSHEKGHYRLYYGNKQFIIDPGYRASYSTDMGGWWRTTQWCRSIYSKNMVVVNPDVENERSYVTEQFSLAPLPAAPTVLRLKRPLSGSEWASYSGRNNLVDNCKREYLITNQDIRHLKVRINYNELTPEEPEVHASYTSPVNDINARLVRNFYTLGNEGILVYDKITALNEQSNTYRNQLHFNPDAVMSYDSNTGLFSATMGSSKLYGAMGALAATSAKRIDGQKIGGIIDPDDDLFPTGLPTGNKPAGINGGNIFSRAHSRIRVDTGSSTGSSFLTLLIPSSSGTNPITSIVESANAYVAYANIDVNNQVYAGVSNQGWSMINGLRFTTDAELFYIRANNDFSIIKSMIVNNGDALKIRDLSPTGFGNIELFKGYASNVEEYVSEWHDNQLVMAIGSAISQYPRFKIIRNGINPENFSAKLLYSIDFPEEVTIVDDTPISRGCIPNVIQSLAYDDRYFYVNYAWADLEAAGLINDDLVIAKGTIPQTELYTDLNIQGDIEITGNITIAGGASMDIGSNSLVLISEGVGIENYGSLHIDGGVSQSIYIGNSTQEWSGITTFRSGNLVCNNTIIERASTGIQIRGASIITNSLIKNCGQGINIATRTSFIVESNTLRQNTYGMNVSNNYVASNLGYISNNEITQNGYGLLLYNSNTNIAMNNIHHNTRTGMHLTRGSEPRIKDCNISFTESNGMSRAEIVIGSESYPIIDDTNNDINADGIGYSLYYDSTGEIRPLMARKNYWGTTNARQIRNSIYPPSWRVEFEPFNTEPNTPFSPLIDDVFKQALAAEESGDQALARQLYTSIATNEPDSLYALQSLGRLNSIYAGYPDLLNDLRGIYDAYMVACSDSVLIKSAQAKYAMVNRLDGLYTEAIQGYEDLLLFSTTEVDSLLCLLDIAYTMQDMYYDDSGKAAHSTMSYQSNGISISTLKDAKHTVDELWGKILAKSEDESIYNAPVPTKLELSNYPNPFNPSTTIAFSVPEAGKVRLTVYNIRGQRVRSLIDDNMMRGFHKVIWDGKDNGKHSVSSGLYFVRIDTGNNTVIKKVMMLK
jgi:hypothetical protein